jgi:hypothetical protein
MGAGRGGAVADGILFQMSAFTYFHHNLDEYTMRYAFFFPFFSVLGQGGAPIHRYDEQRAESQCSDITARVKE